MRKLLLIFMTSLFMILSTTSTITAATAESAEIKINVIDDYIVAKVYINLDEQIEACGIEYKFDNNVLTFDKQQSSWTVPGLLQSLVDPRGDHVAVWVVPQSEGINFKAEEQSLINLVFKVNDPSVPTDTEIQCDIRLITEDATIDLSATADVITPALSTNVSSGTIIQQSYFHCYYVDNDYHIVVTNGLVYIGSHITDEQHICMLCHKPILEYGGYWVEEPVESIIEEIE